MAHIIVTGNEKGGSGKSTTAMHVATALARMGHRVGALDLDIRQRSFGRYVENRRAFLPARGSICRRPITAPCRRPGPRGSTGISRRRSRR
jgi:chromosome partitioning protein